MRINHAGLLHGPRTRAGACPRGSRADGCGLWAQVGEEAWGLHCGRGSASLGREGGRELGRGVWKVQSHPIFVYNKHTCTHTRAHVHTRWVRGVCRRLTFRDFCRMPMGKPWVGSVVSHRRKSGWGLVIRSRDFSRSFSHLTSRWQFCNISHCPRATAVSSSCRATCQRGGEAGARAPSPVLSQGPP